jgi:hypothetical protein
MADTYKHLYTMPREGDLFVKVIGSGDRVEAYFAHADVECTYDRRTGKVETWFFTLLWGVRNYRRFGAGEGWNTLSDWQPYDPAVHGDLPSAPRETSNTHMTALEARLAALEAQVATFLTTSEPEPAAAPPSSEKPLVPLRRQRG